MTELWELTVREKPMNKNVPNVISSIGRAWIIGPLLLTIFVLGHSTAIAAESLNSHPNWPGPGQIFVGACYQPIDRSPKQIDQDIAIMRDSTLCAWIPAGQPS
jgi:hypothetical protein